VAALLWSTAGAYAATYQRGQPNRGRFAAGWLLCLTGCIGVFLAADMPLLYLMMATMTLGAGALVFQDESAGARRAAGIYLGLALAGETLVLIAMILLVQAMPDGSLLIRDAAAALPTARQRDLIVVLLLIGFGLKAGLVPLHVWMPLAHAAAPMPASAVLSGVVVKAGIIGLIRFLPVDAALADWGNTLALVGMFTALYAVAIGITQSHPKVVLAYSSVSQMGFTAAVIGMGIVNLDTATPVLAAFYATHHILVKGAMFLLVGVVAATAATHLRGTLLLAVVLALGLGGLPLTGGAVAKLAVKGPLGSG
jgi:formate hydrogenlyase subunit 3/multisubunit Na+/H+ antiporter MnhD subunit